MGIGNFISNTAKKGVKGTPGAIVSNAMGLNYIGLAAKAAKYPMRAIVPAIRANHAVLSSTKNFIKNRKSLADETFQNNYNARKQELRNQDLSRNQVKKRLKRELPQMKEDAKKQVRSDYKNSVKGDLKAGGYDSYRGMKYQAFSDAIHAPEYVMSSAISSTLARAATSNSPAISSVVKHIPQAADLAHKGGELLSNTMKLF